MNWVKLAVLVALACILATQAQAAEVISLPEDELAKESVLPIFNHPVSVKNRNIVTSGKIDLNLFYGLALSEPIYNVNRFGLSGYYHTSENHAFGLLYAKNSGGLSQYANQLDKQFNLDFSRAPSLDQTLMGDWNWKMFYGKMSITKETVVNLSLYSTLGLGMVQYSHKSYPVLAPGLGQKFYFTKNLALRLDFRLFANMAPIPFLDSSQTSDGSGISNGKPVPAADKFKERLTYTTVLDAGLTWLF
ncbi:MAG: outer membrane beta-barrel domain-containing protein [Bdellovibrionaceae bacterium]|nr:outer membrane beta-barrel domain-containing protein [Pseudobdellovibrionaceae bacterium]